MIQIKLNKFNQMKFDETLLNNNNNNQQTKYNTEKKYIIQL